MLNSFSVVRCLGFFGFNDSMLYLSILAVGVGVGSSLKVSQGSNSSWKSFSGGLIGVSFGLLYLGESLDLFGGLFRFFDLNCELNIIN